MLRSENDLAWTKMVGLQVEISQLKDELVATKGKLEGLQASHDKECERYESWRIHGKFTLLC